MKRIIFSLIIMLLLTVMVAAADLDPVTRLENEIFTSLANERWDSSSKSFVHSIWDDYKQAHLNPIESGIIHSITGKIPDIEDCNQYLGNYMREPNSTRSFIEIEKDEKNRFYIKLEGHKFPAVLRNKCVIFTTGDIIYSKIPQFGEKPYCTLEMFIVIHTEGKFYCASPESTPDTWLEITKIKKSD